MSARRKSGFTLIELLVVIAIIAILAAILFPVFARARETARKSTCSSNMHECGLAVQTYWNDYDAVLPSSLAAGNQTTFLTGSGAVAPSPTAPRTTWAMMIYDYIKNKDILFCPSDGSKDVYSSLSYWWKTAVDVAWNTSTTTFTPCRKESDFAYTSDQILMYEHSGFHTSDNVLKDGVQINVVFIDSHVRNVPIKNSAATTTATTYPSVTDAVQGSGEPMYFNWNFTNDVTAGTAKNFDARNQGDKL